MYKYNIYLRIIIPALVKLLHQLFQVSSDGPMLNMTRLSLGFFLLLLLLFFLVVSVKLPFTLSVVAVAEPIRLRFGNRFCCSSSGLLSVIASLLASVLCPPSIFWLAYLICICISPCSGVLCGMLNRSLQAIPIPTLLITCTTPTTQTHQHQQTTTTPPPHHPPLLRQPMPSSSSSLSPPVLEFQSNDEFLIDIDDGDDENLQVIYGGHA
ncbi:hypothetical protein LOK49_LG13G01853 [Camellia lanceoleosa]|uniref:Uncharacterized protein n=1 Tax=Camellia lanceoleosa TaxID=1840588 RepID=A0ACC0FIZ5_9ERIC|nr:hypothetical protein LOK49_LG13G01853 [Camellia lanceoleosa]